MPCYLLQNECLYFFLPQNCSVILYIDSADLKVHTEEGDKTSLHYIYIDKIGLCLTAWTY